MVALFKIILALVLVTGIGGGAVIGTLYLMDQNSLDNADLTTIIVVQDTNIDPIDAYTINDASISKDILNISVSYSGGCKNHDFTLYGSSSFMESYPVQTTMVLGHNANGDNCEAYLTDILYFNLSPLKQTFIDAYQQSTGTIILHLDSFNLSITYSF